MCTTIILFLTLQIYSIISTDHFSVCFFTEKFAIKTLRSLSFINFVLLCVCVIVCVIMYVRAFVCARVCACVCMCVPKRACACWSVYGSLHVSACVSYFFTIYSIKFGLFDAKVDIKTSK